MSGKNFHPYHLVSLSPWPFKAATSVFILVFSSADWMWGSSLMPVIVSFISIILIKFQWWRDITRESLLEGEHTKEVMTGLEIGMILFIVSEVFFFLSFFWAFFHSSLSPDINIGGEWPCQGISAFSPMGIPLLNTVLLLSSGVTITWSHQTIMLGNKKKTSVALMLTLVLGMYFTFMQVIEYMMSPFSIADSVYGSTFFMATGFHGLHVIIGSIFIFVSLMRILMKHFSSIHFFGFEASAWYWHFVDVVWLFLYLFLYWWGT
uniref:cytochrome c oxidase subunit III n=1 Tax=Aeolothrips xinjiangensis TaxID=2942826 RepID=UPI0020288FFF|nr:cytochrome c oxidase subunit III [Aeolothrips xinjiangensis]UQJ77469.1 cytochrome c oxidase subunit III [Aeolothrips xinjiangensis]